MLEVTVHSTETGRNAYFEVTLEDEDQVMELLQGLSFAQAFNKLLQLV